MRCFTSLPSLSKKMEEPSCRAVSAKAGDSISLTDSSEAEHLLAETEESTATLSLAGSVATRGQQSLTIASNNVTTMKPKRNRFLPDITLSLFIIICIISWRVYFDFILSKSKHKDTHFTSNWSQGTQSLGFANAKVIKRNEKWQKKKAKSSHLPTFLYYLSF